VPAATKDRTPSSGKSWSAVTTAPTQTQSGGGWLESLFGASAAPSKPPEAAPAKAAEPPQVTASIQKADPPPPPAARTPVGPRISKAWSSSTEVKADRTPAPVSAPATGPAPVPASKAAGKYRVQLGAVRTQEEARALADKAKREHAAALAAVEPEIDQAVLGNMGSFYRVRFGPYATMQETEAVCGRLRGSGLDCMSVTQ
jgi:cell division septation protein DedD